MQSEKETRSEETLMHIGSHAGSEENRNGNADISRPSKNFALILCAWMLHTCCMFVIVWRAFSQVDCSALKPDHQKMGVCLAREYCSAA